LALSNKNPVAWCPSWWWGSFAILDPMMSGDHLELAAFTIAILALIEDGFPPHCRSVFCWLFLAALG